jgi:hypothetical protein
MSKHINETIYEHFLDRNIRFFADMHAMEQRELVAKYYIELDSIDKEEALTNCAYFKTFTESLYKQDISKFTNALLEESIYQSLESVVDVAVWEYINKACRFDEKLSKQILERDNDV